MSGSAKVVVVTVCVDESLTAAKVTTVGSVEVWLLLTLGTVLLKFGTEVGVNLVV